jgi:hypothetical protein
MNPKMPEGEQRVGWVKPTGPADGRPDDKLRDTHQFLP